MDEVNIRGYNNNRYRNIAYLTKNNNENKPLSTTMDARSEDANIIINEGTLLLTVASLTAVTFLITAIFLAND